MAKKSPISNLHYSSILVVAVIILILGFLLTKVNYDDYRSAQAAPKFRNTTKYTYSNVVGEFKGDKVTVSFNVYPVGPGNYMLDTSTGGKFNNPEWTSGEWVILTISATYFENPVQIVVDNPQSAWSKYVCGATIYWRVRTAGQAITSSDVQKSVVDCSAVTTTP